MAVTRRFLTGDYLMSQREETRIDCREQCFACSILPKLEEAWECPPVTRVSEQGRGIELPVVG